MTNFLLGILLTPLDPTIEENFLNHDGEGGSAVLIKFRFYHVFHVSIFTVRKSSCRKVMLYKCLSVHREGGCLLHCMLGYTPQADIHPRTDIYPPGQTHTPWTDTHTPWTDTHTHSPGQTHIPQAYTPPQADHRLGRHPPHPETETATDGTYPTGMHSRCRWTFYHTLMMCAVKKCAFILYIKVQVTVERFTKRAYIAF